MVPKEQIDFMKRACLLCDQSRCGYKTGCLAVRDGKILVEAFNETLPGEKYCQDGECVREKLGLRGSERAELVCTIHAEANLIAKAARRGLSLEGTEIFVTTFPCYVCSKSLVQAGIGKLFYMTKHVGTDGARFFEAERVPMEQIKEEEVWAGN